MSQSPFQAYLSIPIKEGTTLEDVINTIDEVQANLTIVKVTDVKGIISWEFYVTEELAVEKYAYEESFASKCYTTEEECLKNAKRFMEAYTRFIKPMRLRTLRIANSRDEFEAKFEELSPDEQIQFEGVKDDIASMLHGFEKCITLYKQGWE